jgi:hypothetical protein
MSVSVALRFKLWLAELLGCLDFPWLSDSTCAVDPYDTTVIRCAVDEVLVAPMPTAARPEL